MKIGSHSAILQHVLRMINKKIILKHWKFILCVELIELVQRRGTSNPLTTLYLFLQSTELAVNYVGVIEHNIRQKVVLALTNA